MAVGGAVLVQRVRQRDHGGVQRDADLTWLLRAAGADVDGRDRDGRTVRERLERERPEAKALIADLGRALATPKLPPGWLEAKDEKNRTFYWSARTKETRWARPVAASAFA